MLLGLLILGRVVIEMTQPGPPADGFVSGVVSSAPFIAAQMYGGYWLKGSDISTQWYPQIAKWWLGLLVGFVILIVGISISVEPMNPLRFVATIRWSAAIGGAVGLLVGVFYARGIQRSVEAGEARRRREQIQRERDRLDQFADIVSHDLRNPLQVAEGRLDLLQDEYESPHIEQIEAAHARMSAIIEDTLTLARAGKGIDELESVDLAQSAKGAWATVDTGDAELRVESSVTFLADEDRLYQLLENLFRNAIEHGGSAVDVKVGALDGYTGFYVEDSGPGISAEDREEVFNFGYTTDAQGTGFGLAIVKEIAEAHGWDVEVTDGSSGGARFEFTGIETE